MFLNANEKKKNKNLQERSIHEKGWIVRERKMQRKEKEKKKNEKQKRVLKKSIDEKQSVKRKMKETRQ